MLSHFGRRSNTRFGRRQSDNAPIPPAMPGAAEPDEPRAVIVRRSESAATPNEYGEYYLVGAVHDFVDLAVGQAGYRWTDIAACAVQVHCIHDYIGQLENGGHSQYVRNRRDVLVERLSYAAAGLRAVGASGHLAMLREFRDWLAENPAEISRQTGFQVGRAPWLDTLDLRFRSLRRSEPLDARLAEWIASWPELSIVEDDAYDAAIRSLAEANAQTALRLATESATLIARAVANSGLAGRDAIERSAAAIDYLLKKAGHDTRMIDVEPDPEAPNRPGPERHWNVFCDLKPFYAITGETAVLIAVTDPDRPAAIATKEEIDAHWRMVALR